MRAKLLALTFLAAITGPAAFAQAPAPMKMFMSSSEIMALIDKAKADRKDNAPLVPEPILSLAPYRAQLEYRPGTSPAAVHETDAELMYVYQGTGTIVTGGKLINEKRNNPTNLGGTGIEGGTSQTLTPGAMIIVPEKTPHQIMPSGGAPIVVITMHVPRPVDWPK